MSKIFRISDGLGNQLFQYACAYSVYKNTGERVILDPMYSGELRFYQLEAFKIELKPRFVNKQLDYLLGIGKRHVAKLKLLYRNIKIKAEHYDIIKEDNATHFEDGMFEKERKGYYIGFWQSYKYFDQYYEDIKRQIVLKKPLGKKASEYAARMDRVTSVCLHIRRTDYNREVNNVCLNNDFYRIALEKMREQLPDMELFIFTDDKEFVKSNFDLYEYELIEGVSDLEEFTLMQHCKHHIIANSTFSWWAAYLSNDRGGIVYAPIADMWHRDFYLPEWHCIEAGFLR